MLASVQTNKNEQQKNRERERRAVQLRISGGEQGKENTARGTYRGSERERERKLEGENDIPRGLRRAFLRSGRQSLNLFI